MLWDCLCSDFTQNLRTSLKYKDNSKKKDKALIIKSTAHREAVSLKAEVPENTVHVVTNQPVPRKVHSIFRRTPPIAPGFNINK